MSRYIAEGGRSLSGSVTVQGSAESAANLAAASVLCGDECVLFNCPNVPQVTLMLDALQSIGCCGELSNGTVVLGGIAPDEAELPNNNFADNSGKALLFAAVLAKTGKASANLYGAATDGVLGDLPFEIIKSFGADIAVRGGKKTATLASPFCGCKIVLPVPCKTSTMCAMLLGATAMGTTTIINAACDPEVEDLAEFLNGCGASIYGAGEKKIVIDGVKTLGGCRHTVMPDISFTAFLLAAAAITGSKLAVENTSATGMEAFLNLLLTCGFVVKTAQNRIEIKQAKFFDSPKNVLTCTYPGLTPQMLPMAAAILAKANGVTVLCDDTPNNLSNICAAVQAFGGDVSNCTGRAVVKGIKTFGGAEFCPKNLSDAQAALLCAIAADTQSTIENAEILEHIYENLPGILKKLGCKIRKI